MSSSKMKIWLKELRLYAISASVMPVLLAFALARVLSLRVDWWLAPFVLGTAVLLHLGTNLINDAGDLWKGVDREGALGGSGLLTDGTLAPHVVFRVGVGLLLAAGVVGVPVIAERGWPLLVLGGVGALGGYAYTAGPAYKYRGLGDIGVFVLMGPLLVVASLYAVTGVTQVAVLGRAALGALPMGLLVTAILAVNNFRDIQDDAAAGVTTMAHLLGRRWSRWYAEGLIVGALLLTAVLAVVAVLPWSALLALVAVVPAVSVLRDLATVEDPRQCGPKTVVERTAKVHAAYGMLAFVAMMALPHVGM